MRKLQVFARVVSQTTTPRIQVEVGSDVNTPWLYTGFVADPTAKGDACDQYNPPRS